MTLNVIFDVTQTLWYAIEMISTVQISAVISLYKGLHLNTELFAIMKDGIVVAWQTPWSTIEIIAFFKITSDLFAAKLSIFITAVQCPTTTATTILKLKHFDIVARFSQLIGGSKTTKTSTKNNNACASRCAFKIHCFFKTGL